MQKKHLKSFLITLGESIDVSLSIVLSTSLKKKAITKSQSLSWDSNPRPNHYE